MSEPSVSCDCCGAGEVLRVLRYGRWVWRVTTEEAAAELADLLRDPDAAFRAGSADAQSLKHDRGTSVAAVGRPPRWVVKRYHLAKALNPMKDLLRRTAAERAFRSARALEQAGIATAPGLAFGVRRRMGLPVCSCLVSAYLAGTRPLVEVLPDGPTDAVLRAVATLLARLHDAGFANRDLKANNILVREGGEGGEQGSATAYLVDLDGLRRGKRVSQSLRRKNLARLRRSFLEWPKAGRRAWDVLSAYYEQHAH